LAYISAAKSISTENRVGPIETLEVNSVTA